MPGRTANRLRIETDPVAAFTFLQLNHYPFFWPPERLAAALLCQVLDDAGNQIGLIWGEWEDTGVLSVHACAATGSPLCLSSTDLMRRLCEIAFFVGADEITTAVSMTPNPAAMGRLLLRLGFEEGDDNFTLNLWNLNGQQQEQDPEEHVRLDQ